MEQESENELRKRDKCARGSIIFCLILLLCFSVVSMVMPTFFFWGQTLPSSGTQLSGYALLLHASISGFINVGLYYGAALRHDKLYRRQRVDEERIHIDKKDKYSRRSLSCSGLFLHLTPIFFALSTIFFAVYLSIRDMSTEKEGNPHPAWIITAVVGTSGGFLSATGLCISVKIADAPYMMPWSNGGKSKLHPELFRAQKMPKSTEFEQLKAKVEMYEQRFGQRGQMPPMPPAPQRPPMGQRGPPRPMRHQERNPHDSSDDDP